MSIKLHPQYSHINSLTTRTYLIHMVVTPPPPMWWWCDDLCAWGWGLGCCACLNGRALQPTSTSFFFHALPIPKTPYMFVSTLLVKLVLCPHNFTSPISLGQKWWRLKLSKFFFLGNQWSELTCTQEGQFFCFFFGVGWQKVGKFSFCVLGHEVHGNTLYVFRGRWGEVPIISCSWFAYMVLSFLFFVCF
jgi:hypothetical protein